MPDGHPTAPQKEALRLICTRGPLSTDRLTGYLLATRETSAHPGYAPAVARLADTLVWRLAAQGFITGTGGVWGTTVIGRRLISCSGGAT
ncbi:hypothetical protein [Planomonospora algeriensis]